MPVYHHLSLEDNKLFEGKDTTVKMKREQTFSPK